MSLRSSAVARAVVAVLLGLAAAVVAVLPSQRLTGPASAAPPVARPGYAVVGIRVTGNRIDETTQAGLAGATFGFYTTRPTAPGGPTLNTETGTVSGVAPVATCTSVADGWCNAEIPIGTGAGQVADNTRLWISPTALPTGWTSAAYWQTAPLSPSTSEPRYQTQHVFQTPALHAGQVYQSGSGGWMADPGTTTTDTGFMSANGGTTGSGTTSSNFLRRTASGGTWPLIGPNPTLPLQCGINVAFVVDLSSSVQTPVNHLPALKTALENGIDSLRGTPSQVALVTFGTSSPANGFPGSNTGLLPVATTADAQAIKDRIDNWSNTIPTNYTNWDAGLNEVAAINDTATTASHVDLAIVLTDGNPTVYGQSPSGATPSGFTRFRELENATASANRVKAQGTRVVSVGVGTGLDASSSWNLRTISGNKRYDPDTDTDIHGTDYLQEETYAEAAAALRTLILDLCAPSISVIKQIIPAGGTIADAYTPDPGWDFTASTTTPGATVNPTNPSTQTTDIHTGATNFDVTVPDAPPSPPPPGTFHVDETLKPGYALAPVSSDGSTLDPAGQNAFCTNKTEDDAAVPVTNVGATGFTVDLDREAAVTCVVYNQAPDFTQASVVVHKRWQVTSAGHTTTYDQGDQPEDLEATLRLGGPAPAGLSDQAWSEERHGYRGRDTVTPPGTPGEDVDVAENVDILPPGCTLTSATMSGTGITGDRDLGTSSPSTTVDDIAAGRNEWTITNSVSCESHLTLVKRVQGGPADPDSWTLHAHGPDSALAGPSGTTGVTSEVTPRTTYQLAEQAGDDPELLNYVQDDLRARPIDWPLSTGSAACAPTGAGGEEEAGDAQGADGSVQVPLGEHITCTITNHAAPLTVIKDVDGGTADPSDFHFSVVPVAPHPEGLPSRHFAGAAAPGHHTIVRPGQTYRITEVGGPAGYQLLDLDCGTRTTRAAPDELTIPAGASAVCTAHNSFSRWTAEKTSDPAPGQIAPGTTITYTLTARHLDGNPTHDIIVTDDLSGVLAHATFVEGSIHASAGTAHRDGDRIVWTVPVLHDRETVTFQVRVHDDAYGVTLANQLGTHTTGDPSDPVDPGEPTHPGGGGGDQAIPCQDAGDDPGCDRTVHTTPPREVTTTSAGLPDTGGPSSWWLWGGLVMICVGGTFTAAARLRPKRARVAPRRTLKG